MSSFCQYFFDAAARLSNTDSEACPYVHFQLRSLHFLMSESRKICLLEGPVLFENTPYASLVLARIYRIMLD